MNPDKTPFQSKKWTLAFLGLVATTVIALAGAGSPAAFGAIGLLVSVACGGQAVVDYRREQ